MEIIIGGIATALIPIIMIASYSTFSPKWLKAEEKDVTNIDKVKPQWKQYNIIALIVGLALGLGTFGLLYVTNMALLGAYIAPIVSVLAVLSVISWLTDVNLRLVDRWVLRLGLVIVMISSLTFLIRYGSQAELIILGLVMGVTAIFILTPVIGQSDVRAFLIILGALIPFFGTWGFALSTLLTILIALIHVFKQKGFNLAALSAKVSNPMVPFILIPATFTMIAGSFIFF